MAQRDKSQGFGFVYLDISKILSQRAELEKNNDAPIDTSEVKVVNFNKDPIPAVAPQASEPTRERAAAVAQIRENLDRLQSLHHKLHAMLDELNQVTDKKKRN